VPAKPARKGRGWMILSIILLLLLIFSVMMNLGSLVSTILQVPAVTANESGPRLEELVVEYNHASDKIAVIRIEGIITGSMIDGSSYGMVEVIRAQLKKARNDSKVKAVLLRVDSPGGEVLASDEIYREILNFQLESKKPVIASMGNLAASGGYYVSAPCRWIVANDLTLTGSIGVIMSSWNYRGLMDKAGVVPRTFKSGKFKDMLSGSRDPKEIPPEEEKMMNDLIQEVYVKFKTVVEEGREQAAEWNSKNPQGERGRKLDERWQDLADGRVISGTEAFKNGFVDELGNFEDAVNRAKDLSGVIRANLVEYRLHYDFGDFFRMFGKSTLKPAQIRVDVGLDTPRLNAGQMYFLSPTLAH
jgi:protease-4